MNPSDLMEFTAEHKRLLIGVGVVTALAVLAWGVSTVLVGQAQMAAREGELGTATGTGETGALVAAADASGTVVASGPADTVRAFYEAAAAGDESAARAAFAYADDFDVALLESWGSPEYRIVSVAAGAEHGEQWVQVDEGQGGLPDADVVTWVLTEVDGRWGIAGWMAGSIDEQQGGASDTPVAAAPGLSAEGAMATVKAFMQARIDKDRDRARSLATAYLLEEQPELLSSNARVPDEFTIDDSYGEGAAIVVRVRETSGRDIRTYEYLVVDDKGTLRVDERR